MKKNEKIKNFLVAISSAYKNGIVACYKNAENALVEKRYQLLVFNILGLLGLIAIPFVIAHGLYSLWENVIFPILGIVAILACLFHDKIEKLFDKPTQPIVNEKKCMQFILEVMTELHSRIYILKPFGVENLHFNIKQKTPFFDFTFTANMAGDSVFDDVSLAEIRHIIQERITERLNHGNACGIPKSVHNNSPSLVITDVRVAGNRYIYECVFVDNQAALKYVNSRNSGGNDSVSQIQASDDIF